MSAPLTQTTGRRKRSVARARFVPGTGQIVINGKAFDQYFPTQQQRNFADEALRLTELDGQYDISATIHGGGVSGQTGALRLAIARSVVELDPAKRDQLKKAGLLSRDARKKESKKYGLKKARKAPQFTKR